MTLNIPINLKLRSKADKEVALAQDIIIMELYRSFPEAVLHGGTGIWRCYHGNRFSEDVDVYIQNNAAMLEKFFKSLMNKGFKINKKRLKENSLYSGLTFNNIQTKFEASFQNKKYIPMEYEASEGFSIKVLTLTAEDFLIEKVETYLSRRKIRDLYDIHFLAGKVQNEKILQEELKKLINNYQKPIDEENLAGLIIGGAVLNSEDMLRDIKIWAK
jgi:predicted nucleotidyltransferase component of viral defense system